MNKMVNVMDNSNAADQVADMLVLIHNSNLSKIEREQKINDALNLIKSIHEGNAQKQHYKGTVDPESFCWQSADAETDDLIEEYNTYFKRGV